MVEVPVDGPAAQRSPGTPRPGDAPAVVFIAGLGHSGTTLLQSLLGAHPDLLALGEVEQTLRRGARQSPDHRCTCGEPWPSCPIWGPVLVDYPEGHGGDLVGAYRRLLRHLATRADVPSRILDSSKNPEAVRALLAAGAQVTPVLLTRDVRAWAWATRRVHSGRSHQTGRWQGLVARVRYHPWRRVRTWSRRSAMIERVLREADLPLVYLGYEQVVLQPRRSLEHLAAHLGLRDHPSLHGPARDDGHTLRGNARTLAGPTHLVYDPRWTKALGPRLASRIRPGTLALNDRLVHPPLLDDRP